MPPTPDPLSPAEREQLATLRNARALGELVALYATADEHAAYFAAKRDWRRLRGRELATASRGDWRAATELPDGDAVAVPPADQFPGARVAVGGTPFFVHGITHADTDAERRFVRRHVRRFLDDGAAVYCEQGIRRMYLDDLDAVCSMDDSLWAMARCGDLDLDSPLAAFWGTEVDEFVEDVTSVASRFRETAFSLIETNADVYGEPIADALGDVASAFLTSHEDAATAPDFAAFAASERAAEDPSRLGELQRHYERSFLPQPLEREWLWRHDAELEVVTHARNERMADYAVYHAGDAPAVHLVVGAAHQPGVRYYLRRHRDGERPSDAFEPVQ